MCACVYMYNKVINDICFPLYEVLRAMSCTLYRFLSQLEVWQPYTIVQCSEKRDGDILLYLRGSKEEEEFVPSSTTL